MYVRILFVWVARAPARMRWYGVKILRVLFSYPGSAWERTWIYIIWQIEHGCTEGSEIRTPL